MPFFVAKFILAILLAMLIGRKPVQRRGLGECGFFRYSPAVTKGLMKVTNLAFFHIKKSNLPTSSLNRFVK